MLRSPARRAPNLAFTLVELLVVIGIIALLISILLPALGKARESANQVKCQAQVKQILQGMLLHANDHKGYWPTAGLMWNGPGQTSTNNTPANMGDSGRNRYEYYGTGGNYALTSTAAGVAKYLGQDMDFTNITTIQDSMSKGLARKILSCPSDKTGGRYGTTVNNGGAMWSSYAFNEAALGWLDVPPIGSGKFVWARQRGNSSKWPHAAQLMILCDANPRAGLPYVEDDPSSWMLFNANVPECSMGDWWRRVPPLSTGTKDAGDPALADKFRHRGRIIIGFGDGHADNRHLDEGLDNVSLSLDFTGVMP
jgi:prepilin-type N-terminal cleavage/methylation domain-containing protein/prepilin-type processing-associated H-X9-DG protein